jgi:hypothetical protein
MTTTSRVLKWSEVGMSERTFTIAVIAIGAVAIACMALALYK